MIKELISQRLLDDQEFALSYIRSKRLTLMKGPLKLKQDLLQKGVSEEIIEEAMKSFSEEEQIEQIKKWLEKRKTKNQKQSSQGYIDKLSTQLMGKGYSHRSIKAALNQVEFEVDKDEEWEALCFQGEKISRKYKTKYTGWEFDQRVKQALYRKGFSLELIDRYLESEKWEN